MNAVMAPEVEEARFLEALAVTAWPPATQERLKGWELGFDRGVTRRANSALCNRLEAEPEALIAEVERRYRARGLAPCFKISPAAAPADLDRRLAARGYDAEGHSLVLTAEPETVAGRAAPAPGVTLQMMGEPTKDWCGACWPEAGAIEDEARTALAGRIEPPAPSPWPGSRTSRPVRRRSPAAPAGPASPRSTPWPPGAGAAWTLIAGLTD